MRALERLTNGSSTETIFSQLLFPLRLTSSDWTSLLDIELDLRDPSIIKDLKEFLRCLFYLKCCQSL